MCLDPIVATGPLKVSKREISEQRHTETENGWCFHVNFAEFRGIGFEILVGILNAEKFGQLLELFHVGAWQLFPRPNNENETRAKDTLLQAFNSRE